MIISAIRLRRGGWGLTTDELTTDNFFCLLPFDFCLLTCRVLSLQPSTYSPHPHRLGDVLDRLFAQILVAQRQLVLDMVIHRPRDADAARLGQAFQSCGNVDPVPVEPLALDNHIAHVDADAKLHLARRQATPRS